MKRQVRIGIDVGGTFTDAVAIDNKTYEVIAKQKIPTTHSEGVAKGIVNIIKSLLEENNISPDDVVFIAHGTTQATNALLEGDVAKVGIVGMGTGMDARTAKKETTVEQIELAPNKFLATEHQFIDSSKLSNQTISDTIQDLVGQHCQVIVASEAYSVDDPSNEYDVIKQAQEQKLFATGGHEISQLYGLKMRTRTAVVNASLIPKMMQTANMTEEAVRDTKIKSNLMIMRCDGGVMNVNEVRQRPILTMLSGLAAGVAGALMYEKVSDGIFFEVGGTSVDISIIKNGKVMIKYAQVGGHKTYLRSLDVRTFAVAGGSMIRVQNKQIVDVGPRSAHIAGLEYECFSDSLVDASLAVAFVSPLAGDSNEYVTVESDHNHRFSYTLAGAANLLGYVPKDDYAEGNLDNNRVAWEVLGEYLDISAEEAAKQVVELAVGKLVPVIQDLLAEYEMDDNFITLIGGGGSGAILVPALADHFNYKWKLAKNAPYISTIGVALAMVREQIERSVTNPTEQDIKQIRADIIEKIVQSGAKEETVDVNIEIDSQRNIVRAIATGATELRQKNLGEQSLTDESMIKLASEAVNQPADTIKVIHKTGRWSLLDSTIVKRKFLFKFRTKHCCVIDREGVVRFKKANVNYATFAKQSIDSLFLPFIDDNTVYSDANATIPKVFLFFREKMLDFTGMQTLEQLMSIMEVELENLKDNEDIIAVAYQ
ncbi:N-methylhydantoinase A/oxoprolinase/acetone carboxylase, beta subunit [Amphibacillus marinus]|uniref:N-methylhydantoinase A/oxoprolinase/acetone carboxylase, beta subunit n=1 Tax=Amphibacillus marinus TaxID=872970 RepID=A0A1H8KG00_9BACI|nr:hydantoinase/oxoprolinase family protein [Amphibacillus marinus]SEN91496.1 N-methylhydantoinase A/oxoprolinase/acetone carboxylase, beta subunit [Amphibacillus marinus]